MSTHREWMYNRLLPGREAYTNEFLSGLEEFMAFACRQPNLSEGKIRCPCKECKNENGASLHTGGSIPHRLHWKRMKEEKGANPSLTEFYFRTHRRKKDQSWVGLHAKLAFDKFEQRKRELTSQGNMENASDGEQSIHENPSDWDIWIDSVGKKKGRVFGLGSVGRMFISTSSQQLHFEEVDTLRSQIQALNESLQRQEEEKDMWHPLLINLYHLHIPMRMRMTTIVTIQKMRIQGFDYRELYSNNITGKIPIELGSLTNLVSLDLYSNKITGLIPEELGNLKKLCFLYEMLSLITGLDY
ncbi:somatic embryogenesis receptor kinase 1 [Vigna unguiculata]|uniref:Somatic embryogenesis receptor kinase 1 n=1 Tax=Vigna unguiculata TaxID=3917 RepID=A0A4D6LJB6_VIGUN|nr:somatic embryogenesis receptor kinase 1 [Vigna unguiculata]